MTCGTPPARFPIIICPPIKRKIFRRLAEIPLGDRNPEFGEKILRFCELLVVQVLFEHRFLKDFHLAATEQVAVDFLVHFSKLGVRAFEQEYVS